MQYGIDFNSYRSSEPARLAPPVGLPPLFVQSQHSARADVRWYYCPICFKHSPQSDYLATVIEEEKTLWIANMITHYRHNHISSWNKCWAPGGSRYRSKWFGNYGDEKRKVNERAKRQIIRKCTDFLRYHGIASTHFAGLQHNDNETLSLAKKLLG